MFVTGCTSYKVDSLAKHEKPKQHEKCALVTKAKLKSREESSAAKFIQTLNKDIFIKLDKMFRNCHALVVKNRPLSDYEWMCELDETKGIILKKTYRNTGSVKSFIAAIADVEFLKVAKLITDSKFICIIGDGSTDASIQEQDMWYVRLSTGGSVDAKIIGVASIEKPSAVGIVEKMCVKCRIWLKNKKNSWGGGGGGGGEAE